MDIKTLFDAPNPSAEAAPDAEQKSETKAERIAREREQLENRLAAGALDDVRTRVAYVLNQYPMSRNSDSELAIRYWKVFHAEDVGRESITYDAFRSVTPITSIVRARATIQNTYGLFVADESVADLRQEREQSVRRKQRAVHRPSMPFVHVYCDESGKTDRHYVVGSLWVNDVEEQAYKLTRALSEWRKSVNWDSEIHFVKINEQRKNDYLDFIRQAMSASEYIGFKAVVLAREHVRQRPTDDAIYNLYYRLIVDGIGHEVNTGRFTLPRAVVVHKDEDEGADRIHLLSLQDNLRVECPKQFDNQVDINAVSSLKSSLNILMQLADVFTGSVNRIVNRDPNAARKVKDEVAEAVIKLLGLNWRDLGKAVSRGDFVSVIRL